MSNGWTPCGQYCFCIPQCISFNRLQLDSKWPSKPSCEILQASMWSIHLYIAHILHSWWSSQSSRSREMTVWDSLTNVEARSPEGNSFIKDLLFYFCLIHEHHAPFSQFVHEDSCSDHSQMRCLSHSASLVQTKNTDLFTESTYSSSKAVQSWTAPSQCTVWCYFYMLQSVCKARKRHQGSHISKWVHLWVLMIHYKLSKPIPAT